VLDIGFGFVGLGQFGEPSFNEFLHLRAAEISRPIRPQLFPKGFEVHLVDSASAFLPVCLAISFYSREKVGEIGFIIRTGCGRGGFEMGLEEVAYTLGELALGRLYAY
jgi:hypothetical protein